MTFVYKRSDGREFNCPLQRMQCVATAAGKRCPRFTCEHLPYCTAHLRMKAGVEVKAVTLTDSTGARFEASGLFAARPFLKDARILPYHSKKNVKEDYRYGQVLTKTENDERYGVGDIDYGPYAVYDSVLKRVIDAGCSRSAASYANDSSASPDEEERQMELSSRPNNACLAHDRGRTYLKATANIPAGAEILCNYGIEYWKAMHADIPPTSRKPSFYTTGCRTSSSGRTISVSSSGTRRKSR